MPERVAITTTLANQMRKAREAKSISQSELGKKVRVPRARIKRIECLELSSIDAGEYARLVVALGITKKKVKKATKKKVASSPAKKASSSSTRERRKMRIRAAKAVLEQHGLLDVTLGELLRV